jgi:7-cyano-7-deazaguanine reductase
MTKWSDKTLLKSIANPSGDGYEINIKNPEITFIGVKDQPDFATVYLIFYPKNSVIELKSLKRYFQNFRNTLVSYERLINVVYDDLIEVYDPNRLRIEMEFRPRGGISSRLVIDSDWSIRGGAEKFKDWVGRENQW